MSYVPKRNLTPDEQRVCDSFAVVMGLDALPSTGWDRDELVKVGTLIFKRFKTRATVVQMILSMDVVTERRQVGDYLTPSRAYWYIVQRLSELIERKPNRLPPQWRDEISRMREV
jgi:hypothetical protein